MIIHFIHHILLLWKIINGKTFSACSGAKELDQVFLVNSIKMDHDLLKKKWLNFFCFITKKENLLIKFIMLMIVLNCFIFLQKNKFLRI